MAGEDLPVQTDVNQVPGAELYAAHTPVDIDFAIQAFAKSRG